MQTHHLEHLRDIAHAQIRPEKQDLLQTLSAACLAPGTKLGPAESALLSDIFRQLIRDVEMPVRRALARQLSERDDAPHDLILMLADDVIDVSFPVLAKSKILEDGELIGIVSRHAKQHALAISQRKTVSAAVSDALVETGSTDVMVSLLGNDGAKIRPRTMQNLVSRSKDIKELQSPLLGRKDLNLDMAIRMADWVGESLRRLILNRFDISEGQLRAAVSDAVLEAIDDDIFGEMEWSPAVPEGPTEGPAVALLDALSHDNIALFKRSFEATTNLTSAWAERSLYPSPEALAIASRAIGLDCETYTRILCHLHSSDIYSAFQKSPLYARVVQYFSSLTEDSASCVLESWQEIGGK
ncbi:MAG: DUF2336 domain-containing protein [Proteobacteria bacterium]|nr:DUF2336 domain-containing protein [Pseudomonadota bacterium]